MTSHGHPHAIYQRALDAGDLPAAVAAAHNLPNAVPAATLPLLLLYREHDPARYQRAAARWAASATHHYPTLGISALADLATALELLATDPDAGLAELADFDTYAQLPGLTKVIADAT